MSAVAGPKMSAHPNGACLNGSCCLSLRLTGAGTADNASFECASSVKSSASAEKDLSLPLRRRTIPEPIAKCSALASEPAPLTSQIVLEKIDQLPATKLKKIPATCAA